MSRLPAWHGLVIVGALVLLGVVGRILQRRRER